MVQAADQLELLVGDERLVEHARFGHEADAPLDLDGSVDDIEAGDARAAGVGLIMPGEDLDRRRLAGAVGPEQAEDLAGTGRRR